MEAGAWSEGGCCFLYAIIVREMLLRWTKYALSRAIVSRVGTSGMKPKVELWTYLVLGNAIATVGLWQGKKGS